MNVDTLPELDWGGRLAPLPLFYVSVASKGLRVYVSGLESTLTGISTSVDSKGVVPSERDNSRAAHSDGVQRRWDHPVLKQMNCTRESRRFTEKLVYAHGSRSQGKRMAVVTGSASPRLETGGDIPGSVEGP